MFRSIRQDFQSVFERDPAAVGTVEVLLTYSGFHAIFVHRISHWLLKHHVPLVPRLLSHLARMLTGVEIHPAATIGSHFVIDHGAGVVIGETTIIGDCVTLFQGVTLGGTGKERGKRHPTLGSHVIVGAGAKVLGGMTIGDNVTVGANSVVLKSIPPHSTVIGVPGRVIRVKGEPLPEIAMDHINIADPVAERFDALEKELAELRHKLRTEPAIDDGDAPRSIDPTTGN